MQSTPFYGMMRPPGAPPMRGGRSRGAPIKHLVSGSSGTLHVSNSSFYL